MNAVPTEELQAPVAQTPISLEDKHKLLNKQTRIQVRKLNSFVNVLTWTSGASLTSDVSSYVQPRRPA